MTILEDEESLDQDPDEDLIDLENTDDEESLEGDANIFTGMIMDGKVDRENDHNSDNNHLHQHHPLHEYPYRRHSFTETLANLYTRIKSW